MSKKNFFAEKLDNIEKENKISNEKMKKDYNTGFYITNLRIGKYKIYYYFQLLKIFTNQMRNEHFASSKRAFYLFLSGPVITAAGFALINPLSVFRKLSIFGSIFTTSFTFLYILKEDLFELARSDSTLGLEIREIYK